LNGISEGFNQLISGMKDLIPYKADLLTWGHAAMFNITAGITDSLNNTSGNFAYLGDYLGQGKLFEHIISGDKNQIGLVSLAMKETGMVDFNIVEKLYTFVTGDPNGLN
jgi:hypothetical protein